MFPYKRLHEIFDYISNHHYISATKLSTLLHITERTIRSDILAINDILKSYGASILLKRKAGYYLAIHNQQLYQTFLNNLNQSQKETLELDSSEDRMKYILNTLLYSHDYILLDDLADSVFISKNTLQNYLKTIKAILPQYALEYITKTNHGVKIIGNEDNKRKCLINNVLSHDFQNYITGFTKEEYTLFDGIQLDYIKGIVMKYLKKYEIKTDDFNLKNLIIHFALMISRIQNDDYINIDNSIIISEDMNDFIYYLCLELSEHFHITISEGEKKYIYLHLVANTHIHSHDINNEYIQETIIHLLDMIYCDYHFDLRKDEILLKDLFNHFKSILTTKAYSINKRNPLLNTIKTNFPLAYEITYTSASQIFNQEPYILTEDEIGYVSLHIGAAIERCFSGMIQRKNAILICGSGQATTRMLEARLNGFFQDKIKIVNKVSYNEFTSYTPAHLKYVDFAISTIPLKSDIIPTITVDFSLNNQDIEAITKFISHISSDKMQKTEKFFENDLFLRLDHINNKESLLQQMCQLLMNKQFVDKDFYEGVMKRESLANTNMNETFAIPHPIENWSTETKVVVAIMDKPLLWNKKDSVQIVFLLAIKQGDQLDIEHLYDLFIEIVNNTKLQQSIIHSYSFDDFMKNLDQYFQ